MVPRHLILASSSPRRQSLLRDAGFHFTIDPADVDEDAHSLGQPTDQLAEHLAKIKAAAVAPRHPTDVILAADTVVALNQTTLGKPSDRDDARRILKLLSGTTHRVITGVAVTCLITHQTYSLSVTSQVTMRQLTESEIDQYLATNQWQGKAGAYGIQDNDPFVTRQEGSLTNIVGLPMEQTIPLLDKMRIHPRHP